jgi:hypothetical protein
MEQVAEALHHAHCNRVIHRDVKPLNIMLLSNGHVKMMDFGIARMVGMGTSRHTKNGELIGTTLYMAPEQFADTEADILTDIFAYGVIFYQLLSGVHPFDGAVFKMLSVEPTPIQELSDCSDALADIVRRALAKHRSERYSTFDDLIFDLKAILLDLKRDQAIELMRQFAELKKNGANKEAHIKWKLASELDPYNADARKASKTFQEQRNRQFIEQNLAALQTEAASHLAARRFGDAIQKLEAALRLRPDDVHIQQQIEAVKDQISRSREAGRLLSDAKREAQQEHFSKACELASQAYEIDRNHPDAPALIAHLNEILARLESTRRFRAELDRIESMLRKSEFLGALDCLAELSRDYPDSQQIAELRQRIQLQQREHALHERAHRLDTGLAELRDLRVAGSLEVALEMAKKLLADFPTAKIIQRLELLLSEEIAANERNVAVEELIAGAREFIQPGKVTESLRLLNAASKDFPADAAIKGWREACLLVTAEEDRRASVRKACEQARALRGEGQAKEAQKLVIETALAHGWDTMLTGLNRVLSLEIEEARETARLFRFHSDVSRLISARAFDEALTMLRDATDEVKLEPSFELLLFKAEDGYAKQNENEIVAAIMAAFSELERAGDLRGAMDLIANGLCRLPASKELDIAAVRLREKIQTEIIEGRVNERAGEIRAMIARAEWGLARAGIALAKKEHPDRPEFDELSGQISSIQRSAEAQTALAEARELLNQGDLERARIALASLESRYGNEDVWKKEKARLERQQETPRAAAPGQSGLSLPKRRVSFAPSFPSPASARASKTNCPSCGIQLPDQARFCDNCGRPT